MHSVIADGVDNTGSFTWTPTADLEVVPTSGYGIQLVVEKTGQYQCKPFSTCRHFAKALVQGRLLLALAAGLAAQGEIAP